MTSWPWPPYGLGAAVADCRPSRGRRLAAKGGDRSARPVRNTTEAFQTIADGIIWFGLYVLPVLAVIAIPAGIVWLVVRGKERRGAPRLRPHG